MNVGEKLPITITATLAGAPGSFEGTPAVTVIPAGAGSVNPATLEFTAIAAAVGVVIEVVVDNLKGDAVGELKGTSAAFDVIALPEVLADAIEVKVG